MNIEQVRHNTDFISVDSEKDGLVITIYGVREDAQVNLSDLMRYLAKNHTEVMRQLIDAELEVDVSERNSVIWEFVERDKSATSSDLVNLTLKTISEIL